MMVAHTLLVKAYIDGEVKRPGTPVEYDGPPNWKFQPADPAQRAAWEAEAADPARVEDSLKQSGDWDFEAPPPPPELHERGYTPEVIASITPPEPRYDRQKEL
ncbi:hypothetical protein K7W03_16130 [Sphingobium sp. PNB]|uniref:hypothetical protein n=1 Tax=Sphingobium sp. PNB TaxID=863934 RepID=UPI001CA38DDC|nr:hypothetical protein [Sphingobium sp. PNB]MCB4861120.1 hypothetical protein [Sphingobium sp. PNB]